MDPWLYIATIVGTCIICYIVADYFVDDKEQQITQLKSRITQLQAENDALKHADAEFDEAMEVLRQNGLLTEATN